MVGAIKAPRERERDERVCVCVSQRDRVGERGMRYSVCVCARARARVCEAHPPTCGMVHHSRAVDWAAVACE